MNTEPWISILCLSFALAVRLRLFSNIFWHPLSKITLAHFESNLIWFNNNTDLIIFLCIYTSKRWLICLLDESCLLRDALVEIYNGVWDSFISLLSDETTSLSSKSRSNLWRTLITAVSLSYLFWERLQCILLEWYALKFLFFFWCFFFLKTVEFH